MHPLALRIDTFESEQGSQSLVFFLLALLLGWLFLRPVLRMTPQGDLAPIEPVGHIGRLVGRGVRRVSRRLMEDPNVSGDSDEFDRILDDHDDHDESVPRLFGRPRLRYSKDVV